MSRTLIFTATYNEVDCIEQLLDMIGQVAPDSDILVVDDYSTDGTKEILISRSDNQQNLKIIHRPSKLGVGSAHKSAFEYAIENSYERLITMDADFSHDPAEIPKFRELLKNNEYVIGSRYIEGGRVDYAGFRLFLSRSANYIARKLLKCRHYELTTSYRGYKVSLLNKIGDLSGLPDGYGFFLDVAYRCERLSNLTAEFPIHFSDRRSGQSKLSKRLIVYAFVHLIKLKFLYKGN